MIDDLLAEVTAAFDEPQGYTALLTMQMLAKAAAADYKVALAGDGGDEVFGGYRWYEGLSARTLGTPLARKASRAALKGRGSPLLRRSSAKLFSLTSPLHRHVRRLFAQFLPEEAEAILAPLGITFSDEQMLEPLQRHFVSTLPLRRALQRVDLMTFCSDSILAKVDRASMAYSLEVRVPFLDRRIVEWGLSMHPRNGDDVRPKSTLRDYVEGHVPAAVLQHPKRGFSLPDFGEFSWDAALGRIREGYWVQEGWFASDWSSFVRPGMPNRRGRIWTLLALTHWADRWMGSS
jgi:asparagine synthase (glutamine-hydrolysing)